MPPVALAHDAGGRALHYGTIVRLCNDIAHLYDEVRAEDWIVDGVANEFNAPGIIAKASVGALARKGPSTLQIRNVSTGIWVHAPSTWVNAVEQPAIHPASAGSLRDLAMWISSHRNAGVTDFIAALKAWGCDYVMGTNPPALKAWGLDRLQMSQLEAKDTRAPWAQPGLSSADVKEAIIAEVGMMADARTPEMQAAYNAAIAHEHERGECGGRSMQSVIGALINLGELQPNTAYGAADIVGAIERLPKRQHDCGVPPAILDVLKKHNLNARTDAGSTAVMIDTILIGLAEVRKERDVLKERLAAVASAMGGV